MATRKAPKVARKAQRPGEPSAMEQAVDPLMAAMLSVFERHPRRTAAAESAIASGLVGLAPEVVRAINDARTLEAKVRELRLDLTDPEASDADRESAERMIDALSRALHGGIQGDTDKVVFLIAALESAKLAAALMHYGRAWESLTDAEVARAAIHLFRRHFPDYLTRITDADAATAARLYHSTSRRTFRAPKWDAAADLVRKAGLGIHTPAALIRLWRRRGAPFRARKPLKT